MYTATAKLDDGQVLTVSGTITQCANWADSVIRMSGGAITIEIVRNEDFAG